MYLALKHLHVSLVVLSVCFFMLRFFWRFMGAKISEKTWVKVLPHVIDTGLLASAVGLCIVLSLNPFDIGWLTEKIVLLVLYIGFATVAMKQEGALSRLIAFFIALSCIAVMAHLAVHKQAFLLG